eukprot:SAG31_NODE_9133_length_1328_cov_1.456469_2_plen_122_part_01
MLPLPLNQQTELNKTKDKSKRLNDSHFDDMGTATAEIEDLKRDNAKLKKKMKEIERRATASGAASNGNDAENGTTGGGNSDALPPFGGGVSGRSRSNSGLSDGGASYSGTDTGSEDFEETLA